MDARTSGDFRMSTIAPRFFPALGPTVLICMGYIDLGKWAAAIDGGSRFGSELVFLVLAFNCAAILCQYLSACVGVTTGKNLAQICSEEYGKFICIFLGVQAELSVLASELTMILGVAHALNLLFGLDLVTSIFLTIADVFLFPPFVTLLGRCKADMLLMGMAGFSLVFYLLGVLTSQPEIPLAMSGIFPRLRGESAYTVMSLLGASIMPQNLYLHSSIVQRFPNVSISALCHDHFFAILFTFSGIFLVNYVVMLSAADVFQSGLAVLTIQDSLLLMEQIFRSPIAPFVFFLVIFFSSQVTALTWNLGGQTILHHLLGIDPPVWIHRITVKAIATILALFSAWTSGAEGVYQMLIFCQVIVALLLPSSVIPLFRVASSRMIMGAFKISGLIEILCLSAFLGMVASNLIFVVDILFGDSDLISSMRWNMGSNTTLPYIILLMIASASLLLMLWLAATPLKSSSVDRNLDLLSAVSEPSQGRVENELRYVEDDKEHADIKAGLNQLDLDIDLPDSITDFDHHEPTEDNSTFCSTPKSQPEVQALSPCEEPKFSLHEESNLSQDEESKCSQDEEPKFSHHEVPSSSIVLDPVVVENKVSSAESQYGSDVQSAESKDLVHKAVEVDGDEHVGKDDFETDGWEQEESLVGSSVGVPTPISDGPGSFRSISGKGDDNSNGSGSFSRLSGLGRAARRNLAAILDEFWGKLFDFHGQVTQEAKGKRIDMLLGLDQKRVPSVKLDTIAADYMPKFYSAADKGSVFHANSREYDSPKQQRIPNSMDSSYGVQMGLSSWSSYMQSLDAYVQSSCGNSVDANERRYSSLRLPTYSEERDYQPATIHGYQMASYLSRFPQDRNMDPLGIALDTSTACKSSSITSNYKDQLSYSLGISSLHNSTLPSVASTLNRLQSERSYYDNSSLVGSVGAVGSSTNPKKYHSLPDISGLAVPNRNSSLGDRDTQWNGPIVPEPSPPVRGILGHQSLYANTPSRTEGGPLSFDELSPSKLYRNVFSPPASSSSETESLWSRQPSEQLFGIAGRSRAVGSGDMRETVSRDSEAELLQSLRYCIGRLLRLEGCEWLFQQNGGFDEELIDRVAAREKYIFEAALREASRLKMGEVPFVSSDCKFALGSRNDETSPAKLLVSPVPCCGEGCIWKRDIIVCFGVWCIHRILEMSLMESRPELWGKYTYVLNRLQGILDLAFSKARPVLSPCFCLQIPSMQGKRMSSPIPNEVPPKAGSGQCTSAGVLLDLIKDVENAVSGRKGRTGTAAGDVAFPTGKGNLASVLKRYKRRLSNKSVGIHDTRPGSRKAPIPPVLSFTQ
ncbi:ethylene-insensitive protein 2.2-like [Aristolochia californica]|uniref:ethylene-insensitive protein 2.2-like n=1 Tax=Aristolochia californica TaxID=171875 RepID=UPI0035E294D6